MDNLYSSVYNYKGESLAPYLNTYGFKTVTSCGINRTLKVRNDTNCHIHILIRNGEFKNLQEAKHKINQSIYKYDSGCIVKPFSMYLFLILQHLAFMSRVLSNLTRLRLCCLKN